jgi:GntR family transcriptional regulator
MHMEEALPSRRPLHRALYLQVRDALAERIASGAWKPGTPIANENELAREIGVSAGTVRKALELLEAQRLITRRQGRGTFVSDQTSGEQAARFRNFRGPDGERMQGRLASVEVAEGRVNELELRRLRLAAGDAVYRIRRVRYHAGRNFMVEDATVLAALFPRLPERREIAGNITVLASEYGVLLGGAQERISLGVPAADVAEALGIAPGTPALLRERLVFMLDGPPVELGIAYYHFPGGFYLADLG